MACSCCAFGNTADQHFDAKKVAKELAQYRRKGPGPTTRGLRDGLVSAGLQEGTLPDIGGGLGTLSLELLDAGFSRAVVVDAASAYLAAAAEEATRCGRSSSIEFVHGDFLMMAASCGLRALSHWIASCAVIRSLNRFWGVRYRSHERPLRSRIPGIVGL